MRTLRSWAPFVLSGLAWSLAGCARIDRIEECRALSRLVNPVLQSIDAERARAPETALTYRSISMQYQALAGRVARVKSDTRRLAEATAEYEKLLREAATTARLFADALDAKDEVRLSAARTAATRAVKRETPLITRIEGVCHGK